MNNKKASELIHELRDNTAYWVKGVGPLNYIALSSRIRLARNVRDVLFTNKASNMQLKKILILSEKLLSDNDDFSNFKLINMANLANIDIQFLVEKRLISITQANFNCPYRAIMYNPEETISIMVNEEDHFRVQCMMPGLQLKKVWEIINCYDNQIEEKVDYAFDESLGYLTSCPTNVGTGLRASVMLHLPGLIITNKLEKLLSSISNMGYAIRGFYGEGTDFHGNLFQISNQNTLGQKEEDIIDNLEIVCNKLIEKEQEARNELMTRSKQKIEDQILRAYGILTNAKIISTAEAIDLLLKVRFGIELGILSKVGYDIVNRLMLVVQPGYLQLLKGQTYNKDQQEIARAALIKEILG